VDMICQQKEDLIPKGFFIVCSMIPADKVAAVAAEIGHVITKWCVLPFHPHDGREHLQRSSRNKGGRGGPARWRFGARCRRGWDAPGGVERM